MNFSVYDLQIISVGASCLQQSVLQSVSQQERDLAHEICAPVAMHGDLMIPAHFTHHPLRVPSPDKINLRLSARERETACFAMHIHAGSGASCVII